MRFAPCCFQGAIEKQTRARHRGAPAANHRDDQSFQRLGLTGPPGFGPLSLFFKQNGHGIFLTAVAREIKTPENPASVAWKLIVSGMNPYLSAGRCPGIC